MPFITAPELDEECRRFREANAAAITRMSRVYLAACEATIERTVRDFIGEGCPGAAVDMLTVLEFRGYEGIRFARHLEGSHSPDTFAILSKATGRPVVEVEMPHIRFT